MPTGEIIIVKYIPTQKPFIEIMSYSNSDIPDRTILFSLRRKLTEINGRLIIILGNKIIDGATIQIATLTNREIRTDLTVGRECVFNIRLCG